MWQAHRIFRDLKWLKTHFLTQHPTKLTDPVWLLTVFRIESGAHVTQKPHQDLNLLQRPIFLNHDPC
jgi:hypothetical protein